MTVGTFLQPDHETQSGAIYKAAIDNSLAVLARIGQMFAPHEQATPNMTVRLDAGALLANVTLSEIAAQSTGTITAPTGTDHRIDRVVIDATTGAVSVITGTPGALPRTAPAITTGKLPICQVALAHGMTVITNDLITDERVGGGGGGGEAFPVNSIYQNRGVNPATELGYGTWSPLSALSCYPMAQSAIFVKATVEKTGEGDYAYKATDPGISLTGPREGKCWMGDAGAHPLRFHIDLGQPQLIIRIYYENHHATGVQTNQGVKNFTFWGSNNPEAFAQLTYGIDTNWTQLTTSQATFDQHAAADAPDPKYINVTNTVAYRYYAIKCVDSHGGVYDMGIRRIVLQSQFSWLRTA